MSGGVWGYIDPYDNPLAREREKYMQMHGYGSFRTMSFRGCECFDCGAWVPAESLTQHNNFHKTFSNRRDATMSNVLWCDPGEHAFKDGAKGSIHFDGSGVDDDGKTVNETFDACIEHNPMRANPKYIAKELEAQYPTSGAPVNATSHYGDLVPDHGE